MSIANTEKYFIFRTFCLPSHEPQIRPLALYVLCNIYGYLFLGSVRPSHSPTLVQSYGQLLEMIGSDLGEALSHINKLHAHLLKVAHFPTVQSRRVLNFRS